MPSSKRAAASSRPETICEDSLASTSTAPPRTRPVPWTVNGARPRPPSSISTPRPRSAASRPGVGPLAQPRVAVQRGPVRAPAPRPAAGTAGRCRPGRRRPRPARAARRGVTSQSAPSSSIRTPRARRPPAMRSVSRARSGRTMPARPVGQRRQDQRPGGDRLGAGQRDDGVDGCRAVRRRPDRGHAVILPGRPRRTAAHRLSRRPASPPSSPGAPGSACGWRTRTCPARRARGRSRSASRRRRAARGRSRSAG